ncbi:MAG: nickel pincer cofactor biosynthesis protein LarB [Deltaproteobacteria bacterium]|nr:nickel pincer cofactor biosynthesis protein LarB [Deltaproteobacteria bacterium]
MNQPDPDRDPRAVVELPDARLDVGRMARRGLPETILGMGKTPSQVVDLASELHQRGQPVLVTRLEPDAAAALRAAFPDTLDYDSVARCARIPGTRPLPEVGSVAVVSAGTSDLPVAREAAFVAQALGADLRFFVDCGVAGLQRVQEVAHELRAADVVIVVAGMDGALPSVVAGLIDRPIIAVPTSVGYGAAFEGLAALLSMLNSCAAGVSVVNIDNGFGAAVSAVLIARRRP